MRTLPASNLGLTGSLWRDCVYAQACFSLRCLLMREVSQSRMRPNLKAQLRFSCPSVLTYVLGAQKNRLLEILSTRCG